MSILRRCCAGVAFEGGRCQSRVTAEVQCGEGPTSARRLDQGGQITILYFVAASLPLSASDQRTLK